MLKRRISISMRLTMWFGGVFFAGWVLFGVTMWANLRHTLTNERRQTLARRVDRLQELLARDASASASDRNQDFSDFTHATGNGLAEVYAPDGTLALPSPSAAASSFAWPRFDAGHPGMFLKVKSGGQSYWVFAQPFALDNKPVVIMAAAPTLATRWSSSAFSKACWRWCQCCF